MNIGWVFSFSICMLFTFCLDAMEGSSTGNITRSPFSLETMHEYTLKEVAQHLPTNFAKGINIFDQESTKKARSLFDTTYQRFQEKNISLDEYSELLLKNSIYYNNQACNKENLPSKKLFRTHLGIFRHYTKQKVIHCFGNTVYTKLQEFSRKKRYGMGDYDRHTLLIQDLENKLSNDPNFATSISNLINTSAAVDRVTLRKHISDHFLISHSKKIPWKVEIVNNWTSPLTIHTAYHWYETALFFLSLHTLSAAATSSNLIKEKNDLLDGLPPEQAPPLAARDGAILLLEKWKKEVAHFFNTFYLLCPSLKENISNNATSKTKLIWKSWEVEDIISEGSYFYNLPSEILTQITDMIVRPEEAFLYYANNKMKAIEHASSMKDIIISLNESIQYLHNHLDTLKKNIGPAIENQQQKYEDLIKKYKYREYLARTISYLTSAVGLLTFFYLIDINSSSWNSSAKIATCALSIGIISRLCAWQWGKKSYYYNTLFHQLIEFKSKSHFVCNQIFTFSTPSSTQ